MKTSLTPITPIAQAIVSIEGHEIVAVHVSGEIVAASFRQFCEMLRLDYSTQIQKVQRHPAIHDKLILAIIQTKGGLQEAYVIVAEAIPIWLTGIHLLKVAPESRELLRICQLDAARTIRRKFFPETQGQPQAAPPKPEQPTPPPQQDVASLSVQELFQVVGARITQEMQHMRAEQRGLADQQTETQRQLQALQAEVMALRTARKDSPPAPDAALSEEHEEVLYILLYCAQQIIGQPQEELERELLAAAGVQELRQIREANWFDMAVWLVKRLG